MNKAELLNIIEAMLFATPDPISQAQINQVFNDDPPDLEELIADLMEKYDDGDHAFMLEKVSGGYQLVSKPEYEPWVQKLLHRSGKLSLSQAALETLAIVAYKQPVSRYDIESIRGVDTTGVLKTLLSRSLLKIRGRDNGPGRPLLYGTTDQFLQHFGLNSVSDLPKLREISELTEDQARADQEQIKLFKMTEAEHQDINPAGDH